MEPKKIKELIESRTEPTFTQGGQYVIYFTGDHANADVIMGYANKYGLKIDQIGPLVNGKVSIMVLFSKLPIAEDEYERLRRVDP